MRVSKVKRIRWLASFQIFFGVLGGAIILGDLIESRGPAVGANIGAPILLLILIIEVLLAAGIFITAAYKDTK